jgi:hypothetical protein
MVPPSSVNITRVPTYLIRPPADFVYGAITLYRGTFQILPLSTRSSAGPRSLAATKGISFDFFSSGYLDVSVPQVRLLNLCIQLRIPVLRQVGFPIQKSPDQSLVADSPELIAGSNVFHRL